MKNLTMMLVIALFTVACAGTGSAPASSTPVSTNAAQTVGQDQGSAQASEAVTATNNMTPTNHIIIGAKKVVIDGGKIEVDGADDAEVTIRATALGVQTFGDDGLHAESSSGGGSAGSTGATSSRGANTRSGQ